MWNTRNPHTLLLGIQNDIATLGNYYDSYLIKWNLSLPHWSSDLTPKSSPQRNENIHLQKDLCSNVLSNIMYKSQKLETIQMSISWWMDKQFWCILTMIYNSEIKRGVLIVAQGKQIWLGTMRLLVWALALLSGLRIRHWRELWYKLQTWLGFGVSVALA